MGMRAEKLSFTLTRRLEQQHKHLSSPPDGQLHSCAEATGLLDNSVVYLGETCVYDVALCSQGAPVTALTLKVECSIEGGSSAVLYDNSHAPLQQLLPQQHQQLQVQTDIKEQGLMTIVASAVFTDPAGERKYHVQFFKFAAASPVAVRTRVRHLPHILTHDGGSGSGGGVGRTRCFLEVNVQNSTQLQMVLHAVRLLAAPGVHAQLLGSPSTPGQQQQQQHVVAQGQHVHRQDDQQQQQQLDLKQAAGTAGPSHHAAMSAGPSAPYIGSGSSDTASQQDIDSCPPAGAADDRAPSVQSKQQLLNGMVQQQQQHVGQGAPGHPSLQQPAAGQAVLLLAGNSQNTLWQVDHHIPSVRSGSSSSSSSSTLGRLELHWSSADGRTGRLLTQPLSGPVPASGKEVLLQLSGLKALGHTAAGPPGTELGPPGGQQQQQQFDRMLPVNQPFRATFTLTAGLNSIGPLLVLYTTTLPAAAPSSSGGSSAAGPPATDSSSVQARRWGGGGGADGSVAEVVVQGNRSIRVPSLPAGQSVEVAFELLPLRPGCLRLPTFVVASEADGRLLDGVHDVHIVAV